jgi:hypothetical protein
MVAQKFVAAASRAAQKRLQAASGPGASAFLSCLPVSELTTIPDAELRAALRLRLGTPFTDMSALPTQCVCKHKPNLSANAYHLLSCNVLCNTAKLRQSLRAEWGNNVWNERHAQIKEAIAVLLSAAGVSVIDEPGPLNDPEDPGPGGDRARDRAKPPAPKPDQLLSFVSHGAGPAVRRVCTDVVVVECNTEARVQKSTCNALLNEEAADKRRKHSGPAARAGVAFVPLVASSLGTLHEDFVRFLQLDDVRLDDDHLFLMFGGRRAFKTRLVDSVSCAIARGTGYVANVAAERLLFSATGRHRDLNLPQIRQLANRHRAPKQRPVPGPARDEGPAVRPRSYDHEA